MSTGFSLFMVAVGAILFWAVTYTVAGIDITAVGAILMVIGIIGLALSLLFWSSFAPFASSAPFGRRPASQNTLVVHDNTPRPQTVVTRESAPRPETVVVRESAPRPETVVIHEAEPRTVEEIRREDLPR